MFRARIPFDALLRILEMTALQFAFYFVYLLSVMLSDYFFGLSYTRAQLFDYSIFHFSSPLGRIALLGQFLGGLASAFLFVFLQGRPRQALDFISTTFCVHFVILTIVCYFPKSVFWWISYIACWGAATVVAESVSISFEMHDMNLAIALPAILERSRDLDAHL
jgi:hypothetical protein